MRPLAHRVRMTPFSATVAIADMVTNMQQQEINIIYFSACRVAENSPNFINQAASKAILEGNAHQIMAQGTTHCFGAGFDFRFQWRRVSQNDLCQVLWDDLRRGLSRLRQATGDSAKVWLTSYNN